MYSHSLSSRSESTHSPAEREDVSDHLEVNSLDEVSAACVVVELAAVVVVVDCCTGSVVVDEGTGAAEVVVECVTSCKVVEDEGGGAAEVCCVGGAAALVVVCCTGALVPCAALVCPPAVSLVVAASLDTPPTMDSATPANAPPRSPPVWRCRRSKSWCACCPACAIVRGGVRASEGLSGETSVWRAGKGRRARRGSCRGCGWV